MSFRHILASLHFNENVKRETQRDKDGKPYYEVTYPNSNLERTWYGKWQIHPHMVSTQTCRLDNSDNWWDVVYNVIINDVR